MHSQVEVVLGRLLPPLGAHHRSPAQQIQPEPDTRTNGTPVLSSGDAARSTDRRPPTAPVDVAGLIAAAQAGGLQARVRAAVSAYPYGAPLPATRALATELGASYGQVSAALAAQQAAGEIARRGRGGPCYRLRPEQGLEGRIALAALFERCPHLELAVDPALLKPLPSYISNSLQARPVRLGHPQGERPPAKAAR
ncbi:hypothetical protein [Streptomyces sp. CFMR 7]|uniref:hypothetical protein n=1 Tax=Streptomyces sp. CFMR 7 TaxID=1649184 RepID=UPI00119E029C|nr:hypothetical protein [Streptomyces sp. CFMR 7]